MKTNLLVLLFVFCVPRALLAANEDLRAFVVPSDASDTSAFGTNKAGFLFADQQFMLFRDRKGVELGHNVPAVWITKPGMKWRTYVVSETFSLGAVIKRVEITGGCLSVEFAFPVEGRTKVYTIPLIVRNDLGLIFLEGIGLEVQPLQP